MKAPLTDEHRYVPINHQYFFNKLNDKEQSELTAAWEAVGYKAEQVREVWIDDDKMYITIYHHDENEAVHLVGACGRSSTNHRNEVCVETIEVIYE